MEILEVNVSIFSSQGNETFHGNCNSVAMTCLSLVSSVVESELLASQLLAVPMCFSRLRA